MSSGLAPRGNIVKMAAQECQDMVYDAVTDVWEVIQPSLAKEPSKAHGDPSQPDTEDV